MLIQNIVDNNHIDTSLEMTLRSRLEDKINTIKNSILPDDYHELKSLQEQLKVNELASKNKYQMFNWLISEQKDNVKVAQ